MSNNTQTGKGGSMELTVELTRGDDLGDVELGVEGTRLAIYNAIRDHVSAHGYPPSHREIAVRVGLKSTASVNYHLTVLERLGWIRRAPDRSRAITLPELVDDGVPD